jgi:hypothetical protein
MSNQRRWIFIFLIWTFISISCLGSQQSAATPSSSHSTTPSQQSYTSEVQNTPSLEIPTLYQTPILQPVPEHSIHEILVSGPLSTADAQVSGLAWYGDTLVILPQYPGWFPNQQTSASLFSLSKAEILTHLNNSSSEPLIPNQIPFNDGGISSQIENFEGYEAIAFSQQKIYLTIEARDDDKWLGFLISGTVKPDLTEINLEPATLTAIPAPVDIINKSNEALVVAGDNIVSLFEVNGQTVNPNPSANLFDGQSLIRNQIPFQSIEYRITDATPIDENSQFWALNIFWPGEFWLLPLDDPIADLYGEGSTHANSISVERLLKFDYSPQGISLANHPPVLLELADPEDTRNWEGLALLDNRGFLIITDEFPDTILAFVPLP